MIIDDDIDIYDIDDMCNTFNLRENLALVRASFQKIFLWGPKYDFYDETRAKKNSLRNEKVGRFQRP